MRSSHIYQTLEDRDNPDEVVREGPYPCNRINAWLGKGYYFWEHYVEHAHWWGQKGGGYNGSYFVCSAEIDYDESNCLDLVDNYHHKVDFKEAYDLCKEKHGDVLVYQVIDLMIKGFERMGREFPYAAIRTQSENHSTSLKVRYSNNQKNSFLELTPLIQICIKMFKTLKFRDFRIIHPEIYDDRQVF
ncbi:MAG: hypothetical protein WBG71_03375 [Leeuwenhoekiella sp.]